MIISASSPSSTALVVKTARQAAFIAIIGLRMLVGAPVWLLFGFCWWAKRAWRDLLDDAAWSESVHVEPGSFEQGVTSGEAKP
jgi:hypothetical protein